MNSVRTDVRIDNRGRLLFAGGSWYDNAHDSHINEQLPPITGCNSLIDVLLLIYAKMWGIVYGDNVSNKACEVRFMWTNSTGPDEESVNDCGARDVSEKGRKERDAWN